jgi:hypothetical protein
VPGCAGGADSGGALGVFGTETGAGVFGELGLESPGWRNQISAAVTTSTPMTAATAVSTSLRFRRGRYVPRVRRRVVVTASTPYR